MLHFWPLKLSDKSSLSFITEHCKLISIAILMLDLRFLFLWKFSLRLEFQHSASLVLHLVLGDWVGRLGSSLA